MTRSSPFHALLASSLVALAILGGCASPALTGLTLESRVQDDRLLGVWIPSDEQQENGDTIRIIKMEEEIYEIRAPGEEGKELLYKLTLHKFNGGLFADMTLPDRIADEVNDEYSWIVMPVHMFARIEFEGDFVRAWPLDEEWVDKQIEGKSIATTEFPGTPAPPMIAASPAAIEKMLTKAAKDPAAWMDVMEFGCVR